MTPNELTNEEELERLLDLLAINRRLVDEAKQAKQELISILEAKEIKL